MPRYGAPSYFGSGARVSLHCLCLPLCLPLTIAPVDACARSNTGDNLDECRSLFDAYKSCGQQQPLR